MMGFKDLEENGSRKEPVSTNGSDGNGAGASTIHENAGEAPRENGGRDVLDDLVKSVPESLRPHLQTLEPLSSFVLGWLEDDTKRSSNPSVDQEDSLRALLSSVPDKAAFKRVRAWYETFETQTLPGRFLRLYRSSQSTLDFLRLYLARLVAGYELSGVVQSGETNPGNHRSDQERPGVSAQEQQHRTKNQLQQVISLIELKRRESSSRPEDILDQAIELLRSYAQLNNSLSSGADSNGACLDMESHLSKNLDSLNSSMVADDLTLQHRISMESIQISRDKIIPLGLIVNELCMNSLQHGYDCAENATLSISLTTEAGEAELCVQDDGRGLPTDFDWEDANGLNLVRRLAEKQLKGSLEPTESPHGAGWVIRFPLRDAHGARTGGSTNGAAL